MNYEERPRASFKAIQQKRKRKKSQDISYENQSFLDLCLSMTTMIDTPTPSFSPFYFSIELALECEADITIVCVLLFTWGWEPTKCEDFQQSLRRVILFRFHDFFLSCHQSIEKHTFYALCAVFNSL